MGCCQSNQVQVVKDPKNVSPETCDTSRGQDSIQPHFGKKKEIASKLPFVQQLDSQKSKKSDLYANNNEVAAQLITISEKNDESIV